MIKFTTGSFGLIFRKFFKQINATYRLAITNDETLQEAMVVHLTKRSLYILLSGTLVAIFLLFSTLLFFTPIRYYLPGYQKDVSREELKSLKILSDSLIRLNQIREQYIFNWIEVANGQINTQRDTTPLTEREIQAAILANGNRIDKASKYEYLKNQKVDSTKNTQDVDKDSLKQGQ
jgi:hypothetical protein